VKKTLVIGCLLIVLTLSLAGSAGAQLDSSGQPTYEQLRLLTEVLLIVQNQYVDPVTLNDLTYHALKGIVRGLDPHGSVLDSESPTEMQVETSGSIGGLDIELSLHDDVLTAAIGSAGTPVLQASVAAQDTSEGTKHAALKLLVRVMSILQNQSADPVRSWDLVYNALKGILRSLDSHAALLDPGSVKDLQTQTSGVFGGLGLQITLSDEVLTVVSPIDGTPAFRAGLQAGDRIIKVDGLATKDMPLADAVKRMRGQPGTSVAITIVRDGWPPEGTDFEIQREVLGVQSVRAYDLGGGVGYIRLRQFLEHTAYDLEVTLDKLVKDGMNALVLDLRNNPGGLLSAAVEVSEKFLDDGKLVVYTKARLRNQNMKFSAHAEQPRTELPLVILVNKGSAGESEIVAGALQDYRRAKVVGAQSSGKGTLQTSIPLSDGSVLRLTTAKWFTPGGRSIDGKGITPDVVAHMSQAPSATDAKGLPRPVLSVDPVAELKKDSQLQKALEVLKAVHQSVSR